ncbi:MAG: phosphoglucosamine mutase [Candidatus Anstonellales archaeon]
MAELHFGTNGIRGKFEDLNPELALKLGKGIGKYLGKNIGVGRDGRRTGLCLKNALVSGLISTGSNVVDFDIVPSPTAELMIKELNLDGVAVVTASHNPPEWNAVKVTDKKMIAVGRERGAKIEKLMEKVKCAKWDGVGEYRKEKNAVRMHAERINNFIDCGAIKEKKPFFILDCGNGTASLMVWLFKESGVRVISINDAVDWRFPGRPSEPREENLGDLKKAVVELKADGGIAWDGDGDRVVFMDERGNFISGDKVVALSLFKRAKEGKRGRFVTTVATSGVASDLAKKYGYKIVYTKVGAPYLSEEAAKGAMLAGEEVGGVIWPELSLAKDGFMTAMKIIELIAKDGRKLSEIVEKELPKYYFVKTKIPCRNERKKKTIERIKKEMKKQYKKLITIDGVRADYEDGWVIVRASGTEPIIRIFSENKYEEKAKEVMEYWAEKVRKYE